jgi:DNA-binding NtrC family response regulator
MGEVRRIRNHAIVVEDEPAVRELAAVLLEESEFEVIECESAEEAVAALADDDRIALIFTDIKLPGRMDGIALAQIVEACRPEVSVIVTSAGAGARARELPSSVRYMPKPWTALDVLMAAEEVRASG